MGLILEQSHDPERTGKLDQVPVQPIRTGVTNMFLCLTVIQEVLEDLEETLSQLHTVLVNDCRSGMSFTYTRPHKLNKLIMDIISDHIFG